MKKFQKTTLENFAGYLLTVQKKRFNITKFSTMAKICDKHISNDEIDQKYVKSFSAVF